MAQAARTLLVVDDDREIREVMHLVLSSEGFNVHVAANGRDALELLRFGLRPSAIVLDLMMPICNGFDFLSALKEEPHLRAPVVVMSANQSYSADELGVAGVVRKPAAIELLLEAVDSACRASAA